VARSKLTVSQRITWKIRVKRKHQNRIVIENISLNSKWVNVGIYRDILFAGGCNEKKKRQMATRNSIAILQRGRLPRRDLHIVNKRSVQTV